ncbi:MAG: cobalamin-dependent protein, partial [Nitrososphaerota archaeon]|nr:cobalamin-dependent protein [Candidatus Bathyarchaeota archaeon]MDW8194179.1 cobalamin-dependent protein [Nitrososphaerota archaeon]
MADTTSIVLVNPPICEGSYRHQPYMPIGLAYLAAVLEKAGHQVKVLDCAALSMSFQELKTRIVQFKPDIVGVTAMTPTVGSALKVASLVKEVSPSTLVVFGGVHPTFMDKEMLREVDHVDVIIRGEGEHTIIDLVSALEERRGLKGVLGITYREEGSIYRNPERPYIENLDDLPKPGFRHFPLEKYRVFGRKILPVVSSRGCPFQCSFCVTSRVFGRKVRMR